jgi:hypothetical protein
VKIRFLRLVLLVHAHMFCKRKSIADCKHLG